MNRLKVIFLGTPQIASNTLSKLLEYEDIEILAVITQPDKPAGRGHKLTSPPVKILAENNNIPVFQPISIRKDINLIETLKLFHSDFFITVAFGQILSQEILDIPKYGTINLHASLLPKYRGANPIARAIANGETTTGITTMLTSIGVDEGNIVLTEEITITENMTTLDLATKVSETAPEILYKSLKGLSTKKIKPIPQNHAQATFAPKFSKEETYLDFNKSAKELHNLVRALYPKPSANTFFNKTLIKILETEVIDENSSNLAGTVIRTDKKGIYIATGNKILLIKTLKPEGKKEMNAYAWACGISTPIMFNSF